MARIEIRPMTPHLGAEVFGYSARDGLSDEIRAAFLRHKVLAFRGQQLSTEQFKAFGEAWGPLAQQLLPEKTVAGHPQVQILEHDADHPPEYAWHTDLSWHPTPPAATILLERELPSVGGDTMFVDMGVAYRDLSERMKRYLDGMLAIHDRTPQLALRGLPSTVIDEFRSQHPPHEHPVVRTHPETKQPHLFVNGAFTTRVKDLPRHESASLLAFLFSLTEVREYQCRVRWEPGTMLIWDNRAVQHYAVSDYMPERRRMERVIIAGDRPY
jgi:taurine dioxygenase